MDILKIIESVEELLYRIALWVVLLPRTLWFVITRPNQIYSYVAAELAKEPDRRFEEYISPVLLLVMAALIPYMMILDLLAGLSGSRIASESEWIKFMQATWSTRLTMVSVVALAGPLGFSVRSLRDLSVPLNRNTLRLPFMIQCYCFTPAYIALLPVMYFIFRYKAVPDGIDTWIATVSWILVVVWLIISESLVLAQQQSISHIGAALKLFSYLVSVVLFLFALEIAVITFANGLSVWGN